MGVTKTTSLPETLSQFTADLIDDLRALRSGELTARDARVRAMLAREVLRSVHLQLEGMRFISDSAKQIGTPEPPQ